MKARVFDCCICQTESVWYNSITCKICKHSLVCLKCYYKLYNKRCPLCNITYIDEKIRAIIVDFFYYNSEYSPTPLYQRLRDNFNDYCLDQLFC